MKRQVDPKDPNFNGTSLARQLGLGVRTVVIDPGHGGPRPGTIGKSGLQEKEVNLGVALALRKLLREKAGLDAILTRESDVDVTLEDRTVIANQKRADLFVSIHSNAHRDRKRGGVETFFLNVSPNPSVVELAAAENATSTKNIGEMKSILQKIVQNSKVQESRELAEMIQRNLVKALSQDLPSIKNLGVKGGPFWVLIGGEMPSVLVEISHLSNAREEAKLRTKKYQELAAQGIYDGIVGIHPFSRQRMTHMRRRDFIRDAAAAGLALRFGPQVFAGQKASVGPLPALAAVEGESPAAITREALSLIGGMGRFVGRGDKVVIKPNIGWDRTPEMAACTNPEVVKTLVELVLGAGAKKAVVIDNTTNQAKRCYVRSGIQAAVEQAGGDMLFVDDYRVKKMALKGEWLKEWEILLDVVEADKIINVPIAKHHSLCRLTLGAKNWLGATGGARNQFHQSLDKTVVDLAAFFRPH